jgi:hypothetical protein
MRAPSRTSSCAPGVRTLIASLFALCLLVPAAPVASAGRTGISSGVENELQRFALSLVNCARTGGYVTSSGRCDRHPAKRYRSRYRKPLKLSERISERVAEPLAAKCRRLGRCGHHLMAPYRTRFRRVGITTRHVGEALGWGGRDARRAIIGSFRVMQREKLHPSRAWGRWHWRYIKDPDFRRIGIGIAKRGSRTYIVYDFAR